MPLDLTGLKRIRAGLPQAIDAGAKQGAEYTKDLASQLAPKDTGDLAESGDVQPTGSGSYDVSFGNALPDPRAPVQEYGSVFQEDPQPYLGPAAADIDVSLEVAKQIKELLG